MNDRRTEGLRPLRELVIAGNLMEVALRNPQHFARDELHELANTWAAKLQVVRQELLVLLRETMEEERP